MNETGAADSYCVKVTDTLEGKSLTFQFPMALKGCSFSTKTSNWSNVCGMLGLIDTVLKHAKY